MKMLLPLLLVVSACAPQPQAESSAHNHTVTPEMVAEDTDLRREVLATLEYGYATVLLATELKLMHATGEEAGRLEDLEIRIHDAKEQVRSLREADEDTFVWGLYFYNRTLKDFNAELEGETHDH